MWIRPSLDNLKQEYHVEVVLKGNNFFDSEQQFLDAAADGEVLTINADTDSKIAYRSRTKSKQELLQLIRGYRSYPEFRNEKTIENLYNRIGAGESMTMPLVVRYSDGKMRVLAGNTRMDVAFQLGVNPQVLVINIDK